MKFRPNLAACITLLLVAASALVSCKDEQSVTEPPSNDTSKTPEAQIIGTLEGTIGEKAFSTTLNTQDSSIIIEKWDGISDKSKQRDGGEMSFEGFLMGTDLWSGPPRLVTVTHHVEGISMTLRFAGRLAVDEKLTALPGCLLKTNDAPLVPAAKGSWTTAEDVTLPSYDLILQVTSFDELSKVFTGIIKGQLLDPTKPDSDPKSLELTLTTTNPSMSDTDSDTRVPANHLILNADTQPSGTTAQQTVPKENGRPADITETAGPEANDPSLNPATEDENRQDIEVRPAIPVSPTLQNE